MATTSTARRPPSRSPLVSLLAAAVLVLTAACIVLAVLLWRKPADTAGGGGEVRAPAPAKAEGVGAKPEPPASGPKISDRDAWTHKDLADYLAARGVKLDWTATTHGSLAGPAAYFYRPGVVVTERTGPRDAGVVYVRKNQSAGAASDYAALDKENGFAWGRFSFTASDSDLLNQVRKALR